MVRTFLYYGCRGRIGSATALTGQESFGPSSVLLASSALDTERGFDRLRDAPGMMLD